MAKTKNLSFREDDMDVYEFLCDKKNASGYIIDLIREDMKMNNKETLKDEVKREVLEELMGFITGVRSVEHGK